MARATAIARRIMAVVLLGSLGLVALMLAVHAWRVGRASITITPTVLAGVAILIAGIVAFVELIRWFSPGTAVILGLTLTMACLMGGVFVMMQPSEGASLSPGIVMAGAVAALVGMTWVARRTAVWLQRTNEGQGSDAVMELVGGFFLAAVIMAVIVLIDPTGKIFNHY